MDAVELGKTLGRIESKIDSIKESVGQNSHSIGVSNTEIADLQKFRARVKGSVVTFSGMFGILGILTGAIARMKGLF